MDSLESSNTSFFFPFYCLMKVLLSYAESVLMHQSCRCFTFLIFLIGIGYYVREFQMFS